VIITSNNEKELPDAFLRRCLFHYIRFPDEETMKQIVDVHFPGIQEELVSNALKVFYKIRNVHGLKKKPSTSEVIDWLKLLLMEGMEAEVIGELNIEEEIPPHLGALLKTEQDVEIIEELKKYKRHKY
jgi:MoxR-like ATPase